MDPLIQLQQQLAVFARERDWEQFHSPKNLSMALIAEAAELVEHFQWLTEAESSQLTAATHDEVALEMADIFIYLLRLAERLNVDLIAAAERKMAINEGRYPVALARGNARRAAELRAEREGESRTPAKSVAPSSQ
jgi:dCTP diphosphatase